MYKAALERIRQKHRTTKYPVEPAVLPELFRGYPRINQSLCLEDCKACIDKCPTGAVSFECDEKLAASKREDLIVSQNKEHRLAHAMGKELVSLFGRSFKLREVSAGGCNACEADTNVLSTVGFDLGRLASSL